jgi:hypothetical protein
VGTANITFIGKDRLEPDHRRFNQVDVDFFNSAAGMAKVKARLERTNHNYEIVITTLAPAGDTRFFGPQSTKYIKEEIAPNVPNLIAPNKLTWIFAHNVTSQHVPLTAWMMAHRFGHMTFFNRDETGVEHVDKIVMTTFALGLQQMCDYDIGDKYHIMSNDDEPACAVSRLLMTMRTARTCNMPSSIDSAAEMLAQFLLTGKVTFLRYADWKARRELIAAYFEQREPGCLRVFKEGEYIPHHLKTSVNRKIMKSIDKFIDHVANRFCVSQIDEYIAATEAAVNAALAEYVELQKGKAFIW